MSDDNLRTKVKVLKAIGQIDSFFEVAEMIGVSKASFYNWINGYYNLGQEKKRELTNLVSDLTLD